MELPRWVGIVLWLAALYNMAWGAVVVAAPLWFFRLAGMDLPNYPQLWQFIGVMVGIYGIGYAIAARDPVRYWPIVLIGLLGKVLGPVGFLVAALKGDLPWVAGWTILTNDLIWWFPFGLILYRAYLGRGLRG
ncbi:MAG: alkyl hydroperoxide reductase [Armatimonadetes bacterium]|nr:alkyl hydroperoxide reductase [Armatimonadota bacterium]